MINTAKSSTQIQTLSGWGLNNPDSELFQLRQTEEEMGFCTSQTCQHYSHDPRGPVNELRIRNGGYFEKVLELGDETYYRIMVLGIAKNTYLRYVSRLHYEDTCSIVKQLPTEWEN